MERVPQVLRNVVVTRRDLLDAAEGGRVWAEVREVERSLGGQGRVLLRPSGTEPVVRVMVEATTQRLADEIADRLIVMLHEVLGEPSTRAP